MTDIIETIRRGTLVAYIRPDHTSYDPRENNNVTRMWFYHGRYQLGDHDDPERPKDPPSEAMIKKLVGPILLIKPVRMYDHSGITISTSDRYPYNCPWDSGMIGYVFITKKKAQEERFPDPEKILEAEMEEYDLYLRGEVYSVEIENQNGDVIDCVYGLIGYDYACKEAEDRLEQKRT